MHQFKIVCRVKSGSRITNPHIPYLINTYRLTDKSLEKVSFYLLVGSTWGEGETFVVKRKGGSV